MAKSLLIVSRGAPWSGMTAREALDIALAGGAYDLPMGMLFMDDGVFQLVEGQRPEAVKQKNLAANLQALPLFGVDGLFVCAASLAERGIDASQVTLPAAITAPEGLSALFNQFDEVITL